MTKKQTLLGLALIMAGLSFSFSAQATATPTISASTSSGDAVQVNITGEPSSNIQLSFWAPGSATASTVVFGTTSANGSFSTTISSGGYGIPANSPVFITIAGRQSTWISWPAYSSVITLSKTSLQIAIGQSATVNASSAIILAANGLGNLASVTVSGSQATITGLQNGSGSLTMCGAGVGCASLPVEIGAEGQTEVSFSENNLVIKDGQSKDVTIFGSSRNGYIIKSNTNPASLDASISGNSNIISLFGTHTPGTATVIACSIEDQKNCATLYLTVVKNTSDILAFSQNNLTLAPGLQQIISVSGGPNTSYYVAANSNSGIAVATLSGTSLTVVGGNNAGSTTIKVCSTTANATCGDLTVTCNLNNTNASATSLSFSQNVVAVFKDDSSNITISGGTGTGYTISSHSNPEIVNATITSGSNIINLSGKAVGSSIVTVCSATVSTTCASLYVNVNPAMVQLTFSQNNVSLTPGATSIIMINGDNSAKTIKTNSNPNAVSANLNTAGNIILLNGKTISGTANITVCTVDSNNVSTSNCATLVATNVSPEIAGVKTTDTTTTTTATASGDDQLQQIALDVSTLMSSGAIMNDVALASASNYLKTLALPATLAAASKNAIAIFIANGNATTQKMGAGERAGVLGSYKKAFNKLPETSNDWSDVIKIANGRWPSTESVTAVSSAKAEFLKVYKRPANLTNANDNSAISIIAYGLRPTARNTASEKAAIKSFRAVYAHDPISALAWDIVRAIAYSGAKR